MPQIAPDSLLSLEAYARERNAYRSRVIAHKKLRTVHAGDHVTLVFEDEQTIRYQVQEMLRIERIFEEEGIRGELEAYNPLIPDGGNWKATMMIEYPDPHERAAALAQLRGVEDCCYVEAGHGGRILAIADEDLERENAEKTSAVHWLRFELPAAMRDAVRAGVPVTAGVDHPAYRHGAQLSAATVQSLARDLG